MADFFEHYSWLLWILFPVFTLLVGYMSGRGWLN